MSFKKKHWWPLFDVQMMAVPWEKECFLLSSQRPLMATLRDSDTVTYFEIWWKWQVSMGIVDYIPISIPLFGSIYLGLLVFLLLKHWYLHLFLVPFNLFSSLPFYVQEILIPLCILFAFCLTQCHQIALFIKAVTQINI